MKIPIAEICSTRTHAKDLESTCKLLESNVNTGTFDQRFYSELTVECTVYE